MTNPHPKPYNKEGHRQACTCRACTLSRNSRNLKMTSINLPPELLAAAKKKAALEGQSLSAVITALLEKYIS